MISFSQPRFWKICRTRTDSKSISKWPLHFFVFGKQKILRGGRKRGRAEGRPLDSNEIEFNWISLRGGGGGGGCGGGWAPLTEKEGPRGRMVRNWSLESDKSSGRNPAPCPSNSSQRKRRGRRRRRRRKEKETKNRPHRIARCFGSQQKRTGFEIEMVKERERERKVFLWLKEKRWMGIKRYPCKCFFFSNRVRIRFPIGERWTLKNRKRPNRLAFSCSLFFVDWLIYPILTLQRSLGRFAKPSKAQKNKAEWRGNSIKIIVLASQLDTENSVRQKNTVDV